MNFYSKNFHSNIPDFLNQWCVNLFDCQDIFDAFDPRLILFVSFKLKIVIASCLVFFKGTRQIFYYLIVYSCQTYALLRNVLLYWDGVCHKVLRVMEMKCAASAWSKKCYPNTDYRSNQTTCCKETMFNYCWYRQELSCWIQF